MAGATVSSPADESLSVLFEPLNLGAIAPQGEVRTPNGKKPLTT